MPILKSGITSKYLDGLEILGIFINGSSLLQIKDI